jgi:hypothetical protein
VAVDSVATAMPAHSSVKTPVHHQFHAGQQRRDRSISPARADATDSQDETHPQFLIIPQLQDYAERDPADRDLQPFGELVETHGLEAIIAAADALTEETKAEVTVPTAHQLDI